MTTLTTEIDEIDAIDWDAPTMSSFEKRYYEKQETTPEDRNPELYEFVSAMADLIEDEDEWKVFSAELHRSKRRRRAISPPAP